MTADDRFEQIRIVLVDIGVLEVLAGTGRELGARVHHNDTGSAVYQFAGKRGPDWAGADDQDIGPVRRRSRIHLVPTGCECSNLSGGSRQ